MGEWVRLGKWSRSIFNLARMTVLGIEDNMMTEIGLMIIVLNVVAVAIVYGNRLGWWKNWLMCATGAFSFSILLSLATTLSPFANGFIMAAITARNVMY